MSVFFFFFFLLLHSSTNKLTKHFFFFFFSWNDFFSALLYDCCCSYKANKNLHKNWYFDFFWGRFWHLFSSQINVSLFSINLRKIYCIYWPIKCILYKSTVTHCNLLKPHSCLFLSLRIESLTNIHILIVSQYYEI